jgi:DNA excision repair protein ERCC-2
MKTYSISGIGKICDLSRRTLLYYDRMGLLRPSGRTGKCFEHNGRSPEHGTVPFKSTPPRLPVVYKVQVRELVDFVLRRGDLGSERSFVGPHRALAGIRGHQKLQRSRPAGYEKEVAVSLEIEDRDFRLLLQGRVDGLIAGSDHLLVEEIKTVSTGWDGEADPLHWAQVKCYAALLCRDHVAKTVELRLSYLDLETGAVTEFNECASGEELAGFLDATLAVYQDWIRERHAWRVLRDQSLKSLQFPHAEYRPGQRSLAVAVYRAVTRGEKLFVEAPTGIGKTVSVLFPTLKALGEGTVERIFYLTARTTGRAVAENCLGNLRRAGARIQALTLTAKEKICKAGCDASACPLARGYYDRRGPAMAAALQQEALTRAAIESVAQAHQVCPFELSLDLSVWVDAVICDYNYVFDPQAFLRRHFEDEGGDYAFLIDEAHNLVDRARDMFSAALETMRVQEVRAAIKDAVPRCARTLSRLVTGIRKLRDPNGPAASHVLDELALGLGESPAAAVKAPITPASSQELSRDGAVVRRTFPESIVPFLDDALKQAEAWLVRNQPAPFREELLCLYFELFSFRRTLEFYDERFVTLVDGNRSTRLRILCVDPSELLKAALERGKASVFFSATLSPGAYYKNLLSGAPGDSFLQLPSPFPPGNLAVLVEGRVQTTYKMRGASVEKVVSAIARVVERRPGNYIAYFPSYEYLLLTHSRFVEKLAGTKVLIQEPGMSEEKRDRFLSAFKADDSDTLVAFAVLGGVFGEGIDLVGDRLIGVIVVGVGLPQLCVERDLIRDHFQDRMGAGFEYAYTYPGLNRVLQAAGRVIRSETDHGVLLLIDSRFLEHRYRELLPSWWRPRIVRSDEGLSTDLDDFWQSQIRGTTNQHQLTRMKRGPDVRQPR